MFTSYSIVSLEYFVLNKIGTAVCRTARTVV